MLCKLFLLLSLLDISCSKSNKIHLREPQTETIYAVGRESNVSSVVLKYEVLNLTSKNTEVCLQLDTLNSSEQLLTSTCFRATEGNETKTLTDLPVGDFVLSLVLREASPPHNHYEESRMTSVISVKKIEQLLPRIDMVLQLENAVTSDSAPVKIVEPSTVAVASSSVGALADVQIEYQLGQSVLPMERFDVCVRLIDIISEKVLVEFSCVPSSQRTLNFREMSMGSYSLTLTLARVIDHGRVTSASNLEVDREIYESSSSTLALHVKSLMDTAIMPTLQTLSEHRTVTAVGQETTDVSIDFSLSGLPSAASMVKICAAYQLDTIATEACVAYTKSVIVLRGLGSGFHTVDLFLRLANVPHSLVSEGTNRINVEVLSAAALSVLETSQTGPAVIPSSLISAGTENESENDEEKEVRMESVSSNTAPSDSQYEKLSELHGEKWNLSDGVDKSDFSAIVNEDKDGHQNRNGDRDGEKGGHEVAAFLNLRENVVDEIIVVLQPTQSSLQSNVSSPPHISSPASTPAHRGQHATTLPVPGTGTGQGELESPPHFNLFTPSLPLNRLDEYFHDTASLGSTSILNDARTKSSTYDEAVKELSMLSTLFYKVTSAVSSGAHSAFSRAMHSMHSYAAKTCLSFCLFLDAARHTCSMRVEQCCLMCSRSLGHIGWNVSFTYTPSDLLFTFLRAYTVFLAASFSYIYWKRGLAGLVRPVHPSTAPPP